MQVDSDRSAKRNQRAMGLAAASRLEVLRMQAVQFVPFVLISFPKADIRQQWLLASLLKLFNVRATVTV